MDDLERAFCKAAIYGNYYDMVEAFNRSDFITLNEKGKSNLINEALTFAAEEGNIDVAKALVIKAKNESLDLYDIIMEDRRFGSPFYLATTFGRKEMLKIFSLYNTLAKFKEREKQTS